MPRMVRQDWHTFIGQFGIGYIQCSCGRVLQSQEETRHHWQEGHFDTVHPDDLPPTATATCRMSDITSKEREALGELSCLVEYGQHTDNLRKHVSAVMGVYDRTIKENETLREQLKRAEGKEFEGANNNTLSGK